MDSKTKLDISILSSVPTDDQVQKWNALTRDEQIELMGLAIREADESEPVGTPASQLADEVRREVLEELNES